MEEGLRTLYILVDLTKYKRKTLVSIKPLLRKELDQHLD